MAIVINLYKDKANGLSLDEVKVGTPLHGTLKMCHAKKTVKEGFAGNIGDFVKQGSKYYMVIGKVTAHKVIHSNKTHTNHHINDINTRQATDMKDTIWGYNPDGIRGGKYSDPTIWENQYGDRAETVIKAQNVGIIDTISIKTKDLVKKIAQANKAFTKAKEKAGV